MTVCFHFHGELNILEDTIEVFKEVPQVVRILGLDDESVHHVTEPLEGLMSCLVRCHFF